jgi:CBS domain-containing protein
VGILGGLLGAAYTTIVVHAVRLRRHFLGNRPRGRVVDALWWSTLAFSIYYWAPFLFPCKPCPDGTDCGHAYTTNYIGNVTNSRRLSEAPTRPLWVFGGPSVPAGRRLAGGGGGLVFVQHACPAYHYNEMATLLLSPQEGLIKHLLQRESFNDEYLSIGTEAAMLGIYFVVAVIVFGISVPAGNFIPALTLGAAMGRFLGDVLPGTSEGDAGRLALMGAGAVLCGVTRMTITLVAILIEVTHDVGALLPLMYTLAIAKVSADLFAPSFDDGMMRVMRLPYLEEEPPHEFELLTARDVMPDKVVVLREVERVGDVFAVLKRTRHSGFPVVDVGQCNDCTFFSGIIVRRHLLVLLKMRVWEYHAAGLPEPAHVRLAFVSSSRSDVVDDREDLASLSFTDEEKQAVIDLRPYMDPSPYLANELMPLRRVYRLFGEIGVRHVPVVDCREQVVGIITRRDVQPEIIEERVIARERERTRAAVAEARRAFYDSDEAAAAAADFGGGPPPPPARGSMAAAGARTSKAARGLLAKAGVLKPVIETNDDEAPSPSGSPLRGPVDIRFTERKSTTDLMQLMAAESLEARGIETLPPKAIKARKALSTSLERLPQIAPRKGLSSSCDSLPQLGRISPESKRGPPFIRQSAAGPARRRNVADVVTASKADEEQYSVLHVTRRPAATQQAIPTLVSPISRYASLSRHTHTHGDAAQHQHDHGHDSGIRAAHARPGGRAAPGDPAQNDTVLHEHYHGADAEGGPPSDRTSGSR